MATLPQDILDGVIDDLQDDVSALRRCALVCSAWLHRSRVHLFAEVTFDYSLRDPLSSPPLLTEHPPAAGLVSPALPVARARNRAAELGPLLDGNPKLTDYVRAVTVVADKKKGEAEIRWAPFVADHVHLARFHRLCSLRLVRFAFESFSDIILTVQSLPTLECLRCENSRLLPLPLSLVQAVDAPSLSISSGTATGAFEPRSTQDTSLKTVSLSIGEYMTALLEQPDNTASARALHSAQAFVRAGLLRFVTSLEIFEACTVLGWLPILETLGPQLHHAGVTLHDVPVSDEEVLPDRFNVFPSHRDTIVRVFDVLRRCRSLRTLTICYDAEDTTTIRMALTIRPGGGWLGISASIDEGPLISPYFLDEAVRLFSGASKSHVAHTRTTAPFPALRELELRLVTTVHSLKNCAPACDALARVLVSHDYPAFARLGVVIEEPGLLGTLFGDREVDEVACSRKAGEVKAGLFRSFEEAGIALDVAVLQRSRDS